MSGPHPTISAWERDHDEGSYAAELHGWTLKVNWTPNEGDQRGYFSWTAEVGDQKVADEERHEEMQLAMAAAEQHAAHNPPREDEQDDDGDDA